MCRMIVRRITKRVYERLSEGDHEPVLRSFSSTAVFCFAGDHSLGGRLEGLELIRQWFQRVSRLLPDLRLRPRTIIVSGWPWDTSVATRFTVGATLPGPQPYANEGMQFLRLRWGRVVEDRLYEDTQALVTALEVIATSGNAEAAAPPLGPVGSAADETDPTARDRRRELSRREASA
jgi:ketosteroid isomerase-like protein